MPHLARPVIVWVDWIYSLLPCSSHTWPKALEGLSRHPLARSVVRRAGDIPDEIHIPDLSPRMMEAIAVLACSAGKRRAQQMGVCNRPRWLGEAASGALEVSAQEPMAYKLEWRGPSAQRKVVTRGGVGTCHSPWSSHLQVIGGACKERAAVASASCKILREQAEMKG